MKKNLKKHIKPILFMLGGATVGYLYYRFIGCVSGTCAITSNPAISAVYMGAIGLILSLIFGEVFTSSSDTE